MEHNLSMGRFHRVASSLSTHQYARYNLATQSCTSFADHFGQRGFGETAVASDDFVNTGPTRDFGQEVYQFKTSGAATAIFNSLRAIAHKCPQFAFAGGGSGVKITTKVFNAPPSAVTGHSRSIKRERSRASRSVSTWYSPSQARIYFSPATWAS
jgi:hypothetical protein